MTEPQTAEERVALNRQLAQMLKGGVIMDVTTPEQARIAEEAGAAAVMALVIVKLVRFLAVAVLALAQLMDVGMAVTGAV